MAESRTVSDADADSVKGADTGEDAATGTTSSGALLVDARGHRCPVPTLRLQRAMEAAPRDGRILLLADDPLARIDVPHFLAGHGWAPPTIVERGGVLHITVQTARDGGSFR